MVTLNKPYIWPMELKLLLFGIAKDILGESPFSFTLKKGKTVGALKKQLLSEYTELEKLKSVVIAVNNEYAEESHGISPDDEIAVIPPVSGG